MGAGKTTIGRELANKLNIDFIDLDTEIEKYSKLSLTTLFKIHGEIKFRKEERKVLMDILNKKQHFVLALGGGTPAYYDNIQQINKECQSIYLRLNPAELNQRLVHEKETRPLISHLNDEDLTEFIAKHLFERRAFYEQAQTTIDIKQKTIDELISEIIQHLPLP